MGTCPQCGKELKADCISTDSLRKVWIHACYVCMWWEPVNGKLESCSNYEYEEDDVEPE